MFGVIDPASMLISFADAKPALNASANAANIVLVFIADFLEKLRYRQ
ncbi:hypothetical protein GW587_09545 [Duganella sp. SAP-35]|uniref:Uncharacterized protein n=1 Tax=Duganella aceris TaxID=2703883 RepID=A0ABX0FIZ2_9BURK|nr:hypothetical protein [Duganella aceris]